MILGRSVLNIGSTWNGEPRFCVYVDTNDRWIGWYPAKDGTHYVCPLPCLVIRWMPRVPKVDAS